MESELSNVDEHKVMKGDVSLMELMIRALEPADSQETYEHCPGYYSTDNTSLMKLVLLTGEHPEIYDYLEKRIHLFKDEIYYRNSENWTALSIAIANSKTKSSIETVRLLLEADADIGCDKQFDPLMIALQNDPINIELIGLLIDHNYSVDDVLDLSFEDESVIEYYGHLIESLIDRGFDEDPIES